MANLEDVSNTLNEANLLSDKIKELSKKLKDVPDDERQKLLNAMKRHMKSTPAVYANYLTFFCVFILLFAFGMI